MLGKRIGERLSRMVDLSQHDIEEVLSEQSSTGKRFGEIVMQLGLARAEDVLRAWGGQLDDSPQRVNLEEFGIDSQAIELIPAELAIRYHFVPVRAFGEELVVAVDEAFYPELAIILAGTLKTKLKYVLTTHQQIARALRKYYAPHAIAA